MVAESRAAAHATLKKKRMKEKEETVLPIWLFIVKTLERSELYSFGPQMQFSVAADCLSRYCH